MAGKTQEGAKQSGYLLGGGSEAERERLESDFFSDDDAFQELLEAEDDLIDAYARRELSAAERRQFADRFLTSPEGHERVRFARAFAVASRPRPVSTQVASPGLLAFILGRPAVIQAALATIAIAAIVGFLWLSLERSRMNKELHELRAERTRLTEKADELQRSADTEKARSAETMAQLSDLRERLATESQQVPKEPQPAGQGQKKHNPGFDNDRTFASNRRNDLPADGTVTFDLTPGSVRSGGGNRLEVPLNTSSIVLRVALDSNSLQSYRAVIETPEGRTVWRSNSFKINRNSEDPHVLRVPAKNLPPGDYILFVNGERANDVFELVANYSFRVVRKL